MTLIRSPESLIEELGISDPAEIDVEAIAYYCGATVKYRQLDGCTARIVGYGDRAIISVDIGSSLGRRRFSIGHELGHWMRDRGKGAHLCQTSDIRRNWVSRSDPESLANAFAAELLMPIKMFRSKAKNLPFVFDTVRSLSSDFQTSQTATAIRLTQLGNLLGMLVCYDMSGLRWFARGHSVPRDLWPVKELNHETNAFERLFRGNSMHSKPRSVSARLWIAHRNAYRVSVIEDSILVGADTVLVLLSWVGKAELEELL